MLKSLGRAVNASAARGARWRSEDGEADGKVALITGAAGGQGAAEAELFVGEGAAVVLTDIDAVAGEALARRVEGQGRRGRCSAPGYVGRGGCGS